MGQIFVQGSRVPIQPVSWNSAADQRTNAIGHLRRVLIGDVRLILMQDRLDIDCAIPHWLTSGAALCCYSVVFDDALDGAWHECFPWSVRNRDDAALLKHFQAATAADMAYRIRKGLASAVYCLNATEGTISASLSRVCATAAMLGVVAAPLHPVAVGQLGHPVFLLGAEAAIEPNNHAICAATVFVVADWLDLRITHHTGHSGDFTIGILNAHCITPMYVVAFQIQLHSRFPRYSVGLSIPRETQNPSSSSIRRREWLACVPTTRLSGLPGGTTPGSALRHGSTSPPP
ncbi:hypothetical protein CSB93_7080 (plasmid) [Pseudomonas paraeruginosa]|uniref:Uncharacterized protein n=1 Tax=Pseudomonas paraeruginosa TaxID=2994495 RepID=A0A2R3IKV8_9PSED|nr:hypothetical protein CSB93_7080 [Pseudomonas paraeruginosa]